MPPLYKNDYYATKIILFSHSTKFLTSFNFEMVSRIDFFSFFF
ncbi:hypothetical protein HMPREF6485_0098 [Segatella buccae ATCC 33574]|uniref:Uncharacterized protein n=1 Tax=Segatella buccae ATCC 33574 TaxID=873513 RepID=E6K3B3_9BACT|nr:hypothetical protein HMPREF6485_0098 [Segatella buccae ATCC 33574]